MLISRISNFITPLGTVTSTKSPTSFPNNPLAIGVLTESDNPRKYWSVLKTRLKKEGSEVATNCSRLKLAATDGKMRVTDVADTE